MTDRKKPTAGFWITVALVAVLAYLFSFGPMLWIDALLGTPTWFDAPICVVYAPAGWFVMKAP